MVFIKSQEYTDPYGKKSKNIICLEGQTDYKMSLNPETNKFNVTIMMGDYEKFIFETDTEDNVDKIMQNVFNYNASKEPYHIFDINGFMVPEVNEDLSLEEIEDGISSVLLAHGYDNLEQVWREIRDTEIIEAGHTSPIMINDGGEMMVDKVENVIEDDTPSGPFHPITSYPPEQVAHTTMTRGVHYQ